MADDRFQQCLAIAEKIFGVPVRPTDSFYSIGGDSLKAVEFVSTLEDEIGIEVNSFELVNAVSFEKFLRAYTSGQ